MTDASPAGQVTTNPVAPAAAVDTAQPHATLGATAAPAVAAQPAAGTAEQKPTEVVAQPAVESAKSADTTGEKPVSEQPVAKAPEQYTDFTLAEGLKASPLVGEFSKLAKEANLDQATAQKFVDLGSKIGLANAEQSKVMIGEARKTWASAVTADKEYGGEKLKENLATANRGLSAYATPELVTMLQQTGLEDHPEVIRVFWKIGQQVSPDSKFISAAGSASGEKSAAQVLFPSMKSAAQ